MKQGSQIILGALGGCLLILALGVGFAIWNFERPPVPLSHLQQLHTTMTTNDVRRLLGKPNSWWIRTNESGQAYFEWAYSRPGSWSIVYVYFKPDGTLERHEYDR